MHDGTPPARQRYSYAFPGPPWRHRITSSAQITGAAQVMSGAAQVLAGATESFPVAFNCLARVA